MKSNTVRVVRLISQDIYGVWTRCNVKTFSKDIDDVSKRYHSLINKNKGEVIPYYVFSRNYNKKSGNMQLFVGSNLKHEMLDHINIPSDEYALIEVGPKFGILWSSNIQKAKQYFYDEWLPNSDYDSANFEYEYNSYRSKEKQPIIEIIFAIKPK